MSHQRNELIQEVLRDVVASMRRLKLAGGTDSSPHALPRSQAIVMALLDREPGVSVKGLAASMEITASAATQLVEALVKDGYVMRTSHDDDRRIVSLSLTQSGKGRLADFTHFQMQRLVPLMASLSDAELKEFARLHRKLGEAAETLAHDRNKK